MNERSPTPIDHTAELRMCLARSSRDAEKLAAFRRLLPAIVLTSPAEAVAFATEADRLILSAGDWDAEPEILRHRGAAYLRLGNASAAMTDLLESHKRYTEARLTKDVVGVSLLIADTHIMLGMQQRGEEWLRAALDLCDHEPSLMRAEVLERMGDFCLTISDFAAAIRHLREALAVYEEKEDYAGRGRSLYAIGTAFGRLNDLEAAQDHHTRSLDAFRLAGDAGNQVRALANLAGIYRDRGRLREALDAAVMAHTQCETQHDWTGAAAMRITIADIHQQRGEHDLAFSHYLEAYSLLREHPADDVLLTLYQRVGRIHQVNGDLTAARHVFVQALSIAGSLGDRRMKAQFHQALASVLETLGEYKEALKQQQHYSALREEIAGDDMRRAIENLQVQYEREKAERERALLEGRAQQMQRELEGQQQELDVTVSNLAQSNTMLENLRAKVRQLQQLRKNMTSERSDAIDDLIHELDGYIADNQKADQGWRQFERLLNNRYPDFISKLLALCSTLSRTEVKICVLTRLGKGNNEIAEILDNTSRTIQTQRLRIRKKMKLPGDIDFTIFITNL